MCLCLAVLLQGSEFNFAPKIENPECKKSMVVCVPSYNNEEFYKKNLDSIFSQNYEDFRVIYIDDASTDNTWELVCSYVKEHGLEDKITLIHNEVNLGPMANWFRMITSCEDHEVIISVDGDDWLANTEVLNRVNQAYQDERVWVTYGTYEQFPSKHSGTSMPVKTSELKSGKHRSRGFIWAHLRTFYAGLFKKVPPARFKDDSGNFFTQAVDVAIMVSVVDLAREHAFFMPDVLYIYNIDNPLNEHKVKDRKDCPSGLVFSRKPLKQLKNWR